MSNKVEKYISVRVLTKFTERDRGFGCHILDLKHTKNCVNIITNQSRNKFTNNIFEIEKYDNVCFFHKTTYLYEFMRSC